MIDAPFIEAKSLEHGTNTPLTFQQLSKAHCVYLSAGTNGEHLTCAHPVILFTMVWRRFKGSGESLAMLLIL